MRISLKKTKEDNFPEPPVSEEPVETEQNVA
jgi:hypothetical protein